MKKQLTLENIGIIDLHHTEYYKTMHANLGDKEIGSFRYQNCFFLPKELVKLVGEAIYKKKVLFLYNFGVNKKYRNNSIGSEMLKYFLGNCVPKGSIVLLDCLEERLAFYKRNGFKVLFNDNKIYEVFYQVN